MPTVRHISKGDEVLLSNGKIYVWGIQTKNRRLVRAVKKDSQWYFLDDRPPMIENLIRFFLFPRQYRW